MPEHVVDFEFEFYSEDLLNPQLDDDLRAEAESRLRALAEGRTDMTGASVAVEKNGTRGDDLYLPGAGRGLHQAG